MATTDDLYGVAKRRVQARNGLVIHALMYAVINGGLFVLWAVTGHGFPWFVFPMLGWGAGLVAHAIALAIGPDSPRELRAIDREVQRLRAQAKVPG